MNRIDKNITITGLATGAIFGASGSIFTNPEIMQTCLYEISSISLVTVSVFLSLKFMRSNNDYLGIGFLIFAIGAAIMTVGMPLGQVGGQPSFGAGLALYVPGLLFISVPKVFPNIIRFTGILASIPFATTAGKIFLGRQVLSTEMIPGIGYGLLVITIIGWIIYIYRLKETTSVS